MIREKGKSRQKRKANICLLESKFAKEFCMSSSSTAVCGTCSAQIFLSNKSLICDICDVWFRMKCSWLSDEVHTLLAKSEVANCILWLCEGCNRAFPKKRVR